MNKYPESWQQYSEAIRINSDGAPPYNGLGAILARLGRFQESKKMLQKALQMEPSYEPAKQNLESVIAVLEAQRPDSSHSVELQSLDSQTSKAFR
jgi:Tfp pilus assembly protein PilF